MQKSIKILTASYLIFILLLAIGGAAEGILADIIYFFSFVIPIAVGLMLNGEGLICEKNELYRLTRIKREKIKLSLLSVFPTVLAVFLTSLLTSYIIYTLTGARETVELSDNLFLSIINLAFLPAILEEALFRYLPLRLLSGKSRGGAIILSAVFFAFSHMSLYQLVYAFIAGVALMAVDIIAESVWPSVAIHFMNNLFSVLILTFENSTATVAILISLLAIAAIASALLLIRNWREVALQIKFAFSFGEGRVFEPTPLLFILPTALIAVTNLFV